MSSSWRGAAGYSLLLALALPVHGATISGDVLGDDGRPLAGLTVQLVHVSLSDCCSDQSTSTGADGHWSFEAPPALYVVRVGAITPWYPRGIRVDARNGDRTGIRLELGRVPRRYVPDDPPRAAKITTSAPDEKGMTLIRGAGGAVQPGSFVLLVNADTADVVFTQAAPDGSFEATLFAPAGTAVLVRSDPVGDMLRNVRGQIQGKSPPQLHPFILPGTGHEANVDFNIGPQAALPGTWIVVPLPASETGRIPIGGSGGRNASGMAGLPTWILRGSMNRDRFSPGETLEVTATITLWSPLLATVESIGGNAHLVLEKLAFADGRPALAHNIQVSSLLTPTGFGIMHTMFSGSHYGGTTPLEIRRVAADRAEGSFSIQVHLPPDLPSGYYRGVIRFNFSGYPAEEPPPSRDQILLDSSNREGPNAISLPAIRVGEPAAPRLYWTLLTDTLREGSRGALPLEDAGCCALTAIVQQPSQHLVVPRVDERTMTPIAYRLEPFAPMIGTSDRGMTASPPAIRFRFPSGHLEVRVERPDGIVETIGPAPFVEARVGGPLDRHGRIPDPGGLSMHDVYQLSTLDPRFEYVFPVEGRYTISLKGEIEDLGGTKWLGRGTYEVLVGRTLVLDTATLPGTPFEAGDSLTPSVTIVPPLPAQVEVRTRLHHGDALVLDQTDVLTANRFGSARGRPVRFAHPGEYRVDLTAAHRDDRGRWWFGSRSWGSVVATPATPVITHGMRGIDDQSSERQAWFFRSQTGSRFGSGHVPFPFHSGDVAWSQEGDAHIPRVTFDDRSGSVFDLLKTPADQRATGEVPLVFSGKNGNDPHFEPEAVPIWAYTYRSVQRPSVRIREQITATSSLPSLYWRFSDQYGQQSGNGRNGDRPNDFKFQYAAVVIRGQGVPQPHYSIYGSLFVLVPDFDPENETRTFPPFQGNGGGPSGGPLFTLKGREIDLFFHPTAVRPGTILHRGAIASFGGYSAPTLPSKIEIVVTSPSGARRTISGQANGIGYFHDPSQDFGVHESGLWKAKVKILFDGRTSAGQVTDPHPMGDVLGSREGEFYFYVVDSDSAPADIANVHVAGTPAAPSRARSETAGVDSSFVRPADGPITFILAKPAGLNEVKLTYTTTMPGFILEEGTSSSLAYTYDAQRLAQDFPNLDLHDADGFAGVDTITISFLVSGADDAGKMQHHARQIVIQGEELQMPAQDPRPRRRAVRK